MRGGITPTEKGKTNRAHLRHQMTSPGKLYFEDQVVDCVVLNFSVGGAMIRMSGPIDGASQVRLRIEPIGEFAGRVAWGNGATLGITAQNRTHPSGHAAAEARAAISHAEASNSQPFLNWRVAF